MQIINNRARRLTLIDVEQSIKRWLDLLLVARLPRVQSRLDISQESHECERQVLRLLLRVSIGPWVGPLARRRPLTRGVPMCQAKPQTRPPLSAQSAFFSFWGSPQSWGRCWDN